MKKQSRERFVEECLAELADIQGPFSKMWNAIGMYKSALANLTLQPDAAVQLAPIAPAVIEPASTAEIAQYLTSVIGDVRIMAEKSAMPFAAYLLDVAVEELDRHAHGLFEEDDQLELPLELPPRPARH